MAPSCRCGIECRQCCPGGSTLREPGLRAGMAPRIRSFAAEGSGDPAARARSGLEEERVWNGVGSAPPGARSPWPVKGTWYIETAQRASAIAALRRGIDLGMTHIDTAEMYGAGAAEQIVGEAIAGRRDEVFLVSKVLPQNASRRGTLAACERSLGRLNTDRLDCYLLHWRGQYPLEDTFAAFEQLADRGQDPVLGREQLRRCRSRGSERASRNLDTSPAIKCSITCRNGPSSTPSFHGARSTVWPSSATARSVTAASRAREPAAGRVLQQIAAAHNATARQVALRFLVRRPALFTIPKASSPQHAVENAGAGDLPIDRCGAGADRRGRSRSARARAACRCCESGRGL